MIILPRKARIHTTSRWHIPTSFSESGLLWKLLGSTWLRQVVRFLVVGIVNTAIDASIYFALTRWMGLSALPVLAKSISYGIGIINSFYWNRRWTFRSDVRVATALALFVLLNLIGLALNATAMYLSLSIMGLHEVPSLIFATAVAFAWNFCTSKFLIFERRLLGDHQHTIE